MQTVIAIIALAGPSMCLFARYISEYGFSFGKEDGWGIFPALAAMLLAVHAAFMLSPEAVQLLSEQFFPVRGFLFFLVSGVAFSVAIFPQIVAESATDSPVVSDIKIKSLVAIEAPWPLKSGRISPEICCEIWIDQEKGMAIQCMLDKPDDFFASAHFWHSINHPELRDRHQRFN